MMAAHHSLGQKRRGTVDGERGIRQKGAGGVKAADSVTTEVYVWGENTCYQLGLKKLEEGDNPEANNQEKKTPTLLAGLSGIVTIKAAGLLSAAIDADGRVWTWGANDDGALGWGGIPDEEFELDPSPRTVVGLENQKVVEIGIGEGHMCALTDTGRVFHWGTYAVEEFGKRRKYIEGKPRLDRASPVKGTEGLSFAHIACSSSQGLGVTTSGELWIWGAPLPQEMDRYRKMLPFHDPYVFFQPMVVRVPEILSDEERTQWEEEGDPFKPPLVKFDRPFAGEYTKGAIDAQGRVWSWGNNGYCQCGYKTKENQLQLTPRLVKAMTKYKIADVQCSQNHAMFLTDDGRVAAVGKNSDGQCGLGEDVREADGFRAVTRYNPALRPGEKVVSFSCGWGHSLMATDGNRLYVMGQPEHAGMGAREDCVYVPHLNKRPPLKDPKVRVLAVACGSSHSLMLVEK